MHIICQQDQLTQALSTVTRAISSRSTLPILANILITAQKRTLTLSATNLEMSITLRLDTEILSPGTITLPGKLLHELIGSFADCRVEILVPDGSTTAQITTRHNQASLKGMDAAEFPQILSCDDGLLPISLDAALLKEVIGQVAFAAASDDSRPVLAGVLVQFHENTITLASADAFRLAMCSASREQTDEELTPSSILIPARTLTELARLLPTEGQVELTVSANPNQVLFHVSNLDLVSRLIEGTFPPYQNLIPKSYTTRAVLDRSEFLAALKSATLFTDGSSRTMQISIKAPETDLGNGVLTIDAQAEAKGDGASTLDASVEGPPIQMIFSSKYLTDALAAISTPAVALETTTTSQPGVLKPVGELSGSQLYVVMPMHKL